ncbi:hypothetical protein LX36DRAFT_18927 [Colletotrichum falcatum]|nr:hypothetical protein LX36DRAFT_18927 [Colletotrichum falcatum]
MTFAQPSNPSQRPRRRRRSAPLPTRIRPSFSKPPLSPKLAKSLTLPPLLLRPMRWSSVAFPAMKLYLDQVPRAPPTEG